MKGREKKKNNSEFRALYLHALTHFYNKTSREHAKQRKALTQL
jgi:hypothetical protein